MTTTRQDPYDAVAAALVAHPGATAAQVAEAAGIGRSTAAKVLAAMEDRGVARRDPGGRDGGRQLADRWHLVEAGAAGGVPDVAGGEPNVAGDDPDKVAAPDPAAVVGDDPGRGDVGDAVVAVAGSTEFGRLGRGALRALVLDYLGAHGGADGLGPAAVAKGLGGKSSGAVGNALARLEADGAVRLVTERPRRYVIVS
jgi:DNA-binding transcriptional ArsR family regulator